MVEIDAVIALVNRVLARVEIEGVDFVRGFELGRPYITLTLRRTQLHYRLVVREEFDDELLVRQIYTAYASLVLAQAQSDFRIDGQPLAMSRAYLGETRFETPRRNDLF